MSDKPEPRQFVVPTPAGETLSASASERTAPHAYRKTAAALPIGVYGEAAIAEQEDAVDLDRTGIPELPHVVVELKDQLRRLIQSNQTQESKLRQAQQRLAEERRDREELIGRLKKLEHEASVTADRDAETARLRRERDALAGQVMDLEQELAASEQRVCEVGELLDRFRSERNDASEEAACLDSQFSRAITVIRELRAALDASREREEALQQRAGQIEQQLELIADERDAFEAELQESQSALESVRQSLLAVSSDWRASYER